MFNEDLIKTLIIVTGWPILWVFSILIILEGWKFYSKLNDTVIGKLIIPTVLGWILGMFSLGIVATAYIYDEIWYRTVIPVFGIFLIGIIFLYWVMRRWQEQAIELRKFYKNLEDLVEERTNELTKMHARQLKHEKEIQKLKDQFVFIAAHELKTPVTAIKWAIETAFDADEKVKDPEIKESLETVQESNLRLIRLIDDILNIARLDAGKIQMNFSEFDLKELVSETVENMGANFKEKDLKIKTSLGKKKVIAYSDPERVKQVLINFLSNAEKYNNKSGSISVSIESEKNGSLKVSVTDSGIGIKPEDIKKLFTQFSRIQNEKTKNIEGTGLGLFLCKQMVEAWNGKIGVESEYGEGSKFYFTIPAKK